MINNLPEREITKIWQHQLLDRTGLVTEEGEPVEIIYPGRLNHDEGADFRDAVIVIGRGLMKGDIEVHVRSGDWWGHRHHLDAVYNRVILHVVMWHNTKTATSLQNGSKIPILALHKYIGIPVSRWPNLPCLPTSLNMPCGKVTQRLAIDEMVRFLDKAGEERFLAKAARFQRELAQVEASQTLYQGIMGALGYVKNKLPFQELARRLPLKNLELITQANMPGDECLARQQALLLGMAGLLPSLRQGNRLEERWVDKLERLWASCHHTRVMSQSDWHLFKVRPNNQPILRLVAVSYLGLRYRGKGMFEELLNLVKAVPVSGSHHRLEAALLVTASDYWETRFDFGSGGGIRSPTLLGAGRAADIVVNVLLPFTFAWGQFNSQPEPGRKALALYRCYPKLTANSVERHMKNQLGLSSDLVNSARRQQGLIHIYETLCTQGRCSDCPLTQLEAGNHVQI